MGHSSPKTTEIYKRTERYEWRESKRDSVAGYHKKFVKQNIDNEKTDTKIKLKSFSEMKMRLRDIFKNII